MGELPNFGEGAQPAHGIDAPGGIGRGAAQGAPYH